MCLSTKNLLVAAITVANVFSVNALSTNRLTARGLKQVRDEKPSNPFDPNTTKYCSYWWDNDGSFPCADLPEAWSISMEDFLRWNPSITPTCGNFVTGKSYCVEASNEPPVVTTGPTVPSTTTTRAAATTTTAGNGITTPTPIQPGIVSNCNKFYLVKSGDFCQAIADKSGISISQFTTWNPEVGGSSCSGLWADVYVCTGTTDSKPPATTTKSGNGIATPTPIQPGIVGNCNKFYQVKSGDYCQSIATNNGITLSQFTTWNPEVGGSSCSGLWANVYVCVGTTDYKPPVTTTKPANGIATPTPTQSGMTKNCKSFYFVKAGDSCVKIASAYKITTQNFISWNPAVKSDCTGLFASTYSCVAVL